MKEAPMPVKVEGADTKSVQPMRQLIRTPVTELFGIQHPVILAGMNQAAGPELAAAISNAGGLGVVGGVGWTPSFLREQVKELKAGLRDPERTPWGVDLLLPQVGGNARKTNKDYTKGKLDELIDIVIAEKASLFVAAVGIPPPKVVKRLHDAGIPIMNVVGHPKHVPKALDAGVDLICAQGGEAGGHTGDIPFSVLIPKVVDVCRGRNSPLTGKPVEVIAAGGIFDGRGLAAALCHGASAVWVGTRFVCAAEAGAPKAHQQAIINSNHDSFVRTIIFTGRPLRLIKTPYVEAWEAQPAKIKELTSKGIVPVEWDLEQDEADEAKAQAKMQGALAHHFAGHAAAMVHEVKPGKQILDEMVEGAVRCLRVGHATLCGGSAKL